MTTTRRRRRPSSRLLPAPTVGLFGHTFELKPDGFERIKYQFRVQARTAGGRYLLQLFSWLMGDPTHQRLVEESWFVTHRARFYSSIEHWRDEGDHHSTAGARYDCQQAGISYHGAGTGYTSNEVAALLDDGRRH